MTYLVEIDYSQIELRIAAEYIHREVLPDNPMLEAYRRGDDLHKLIVQASFGTPVDEVTKEERQAGKAINFGFIFGMFPEKFVTQARDAYGVHVTLEEAANMRDVFFDTWKGLEHWHNHTRALLARNGYVANLFGRRRRLPDVWSEDRFNVLQAERQAINMRVQSTAADLMAKAMVAIDRYQQRSPVRTHHIVGTVHDSILLEVPEKDAHRHVVDVCELMVNPDLKFSLTVPLEVEASIARHWGDSGDTLVISNLDNDK